MSSRIRISGLIVLIGLLVLTSAPATTAKSVEVAIAGTSEQIDAFDREDMIYFSFSELVEIIGGTVDWKVIGHVVAYTEGSARIEFLLGSPFITLYDTVYNLTYPTEFRDGKLFLPAETFIPLLNRILPQKITWDGSREEIRVDAEIYNVTDLTVTAKANGLLIEIFLTRGDVVRNFRYRR